MGKIGARCYYEYLLIMFLRHKIQNKLSIIISIKQEKYQFKQKKKLEVKKKWLMLQIRWIVREMFALTPT